MKLDVTLPIEPSRNCRAPPDDRTIPQSLLVCADELIRYWSIPT
jgi:hypothetical protein